MTDTHPPTDDPTADSTDAILTPATVHDALAKPEYRLLLDHLAKRYRERGPDATMRLPRGELVATIRETLEREPAPFGPRTPTAASTETDATDRAVIIVYHVAVPKLADLGFCSYDYDVNEVVVTPAQYVAIHHLMQIDAFVRGVCDAAVGRGPAVGVDE